MYNRYNFIEVNNPNIPVLTKEECTPFGQFVESPQNPNDEFDESIATVKSRDMFLANFSMRAVEAEFSENVSFLDKHGVNNHLLGSCIFFKGAVQSFNKRGELRAETYQRTQNFKYDPNNDLFHYVEKNMPLSFVRFSYSREYIDRLLPENERWSDHLKNDIDYGEPIIGRKATPITLLQERAFQNIFDCPLSGKLGVMMIETSVTQIVLLQLNALFNSQPKRTQGIAKRDLDLINEVKEYISKTFLDDHSIVGIARHFGTNTNKLMSLFKRMFGQSIFEYISDKRMEFAMHLLRERNLSVMEISRTLGYKNPNHFSAAFKKKFNMTPSSVA